MDNLKVASKLMRLAKSLLAVRGKAQKVLMEYLKPYAGKELLLSNIVRHPSFRGIHFGKVQSAAEALKKQGLVEYDGYAKIKLIPGKTAGIEDVHMERRTQRQLENTVKNRMSSARDKYRKLNFKGCIGDLMSAQAAVSALGHDQEARAFADLMDAVRDAEKVHDIVRDKWMDVMI